MSEYKKGAGVLPYCIKQREDGTNEVFFLFHQTFEGKKQNTLVDFGGAVEEGEDLIYSAAREWAEETLGLFLTLSYNKESEKKSIDDCTQHTLQLLLAPSSPSLYPLASSYNYHIFFFKIPFQNLDIINSEFTKVSKKRKFWWVSARDVMDGRTPMKLYARLEVIQQKTNEVIKLIMKDNNATP